MADDGAELVKYSDAPERAVQRVSIKAQSTAIARATAWPTKVSGTDLKSTGNEVAVETIVISHEGLTIAHS